MRIEYLTTKAKAKQLKYDSQVVIASHRNKSKHKRIVSQYRKQHPWCERCMTQRHALTPMNECHHIVPVSEGGPTTNDNLLSLCRECHLAIPNETRQEQISYKQIDIYTG